MLAKQPSWRRFVVLKREQNLSYMTKMVSWVEIYVAFNILHLLGSQLEPTEIHLIPSLEVSCKCMRSFNLIFKHYQRGVHDIEHQITFHGSNFIFHDSQGFEAGASEELDAVWAFIQNQSAKIEMRDQLHAIWCVVISSSHDWLTKPYHRYCVPMDSPRPVLPAELEFFNKGTGKGVLSLVFNVLPFCTVLHDHICISHDLSTWMCWPVIVTL